MATDVSTENPAREEDELIDGGEDQTDATTLDYSDDDSDLPESIRNLKPLVRSGGILPATYNTMVRRYRRIAARIAPLLTVDQYQSCLFRLNDPNVSSREFAADVGLVVWAMTRPAGRNRVRSLIEEFTREQIDVAAGVSEPARPRRRGRGRSRGPVSPERREQLKESLARGRATLAARKAQEAAESEPSRTQPPAPVTRREIGNGRRTRTSSRSRR